MEKLLKFITDHVDDNVSRLILDRKKYPGINIDIAVNSIESRRKLKGKVQEWYEQPRLIFPLKLSAEQCSSSATGAYKAELAEHIADTHEWTIADLTGGLGVDSWFFSKRAAKVIYNEMQTPLCDAARHNFKVLEADNIVVLNSTVTAGRCIDSILPPGMSEQYPDIIYMDPARRGEGGKKVFLIEECTPDVLTLKDELFSIARHILIKLSPMADITMVCDRLGTTCREVHVVATGGECKELLIWMDSEWNSEYTITAVELHPDSPATTFSFSPSEEKSSDFISSLLLTESQSEADGRQWLEKTCHPRLGGVSETKSMRRGSSESMPFISGWFLFEPGKALMKAGCFNLIASRFSLHKLGRSTHYYLTDSAEKALSLKAYGKVFEILECHSLDKRSIKGIGRKYPKAEVTARNIPMDTDTLRKKAGVTSGDNAHIFGLKSDAEGNLLIAARRI